MVQEYLKDPGAYRQLMKYAEIFLMKYMILYHSDFVTFTQK